MKLINLKTDFLGRNFIFHNKIDSTQNEVWRIIQNGNIQNGTLVMADIQTEGKGTHGRTWYTDEPNNIAFSFYVKTDCNVNKLEGLTIEIAKVIVNVFKEEYDIHLNIDEPNDITLENKKIGGILTESKINSELVRFLVIGIGINTTKINFADDIKQLATSIKQECGIVVNREKIISSFCNKFENVIKNRLES